MTFIDLTGQRFGRLIVVSYIGNSRWDCKCDCGGNKIVHSSSLRNGYTKSCGCLSLENTYNLNMRRRKEGRDKIDKFISELVGKTHGNVMYLKEDVKRREEELKKGNHYYFIECKCLICGKIFSMRTHDVKEYHIGCQICTRRIVGKNSAKNGNIWCVDGEQSYCNIKGNIVYIDTEDLYKVKNYMWHVQHTGIVASYQKGSRNRTTGNGDKSVLLSRLIFDLDESDKIIVDHINGNRLINKKSNLRLCNVQNNCRNRKQQINNTTGFTGVKLRKNGKYESLLYITDLTTGEMKRKYLGTFKNFEDAIIARGDAELKVYGEYSGLYRRHDEMEMYLKAKEKVVNVIQTML